MKAKRIFGLFAVLAVLLFGVNAVTLTSDARNSCVDGITAKSLASGDALIFIATADGADTLAVFVVDTTAVLGASGGVFTADTSGVTDDTNADGTGTAAVFYLSQADSTEVLSGTVTATGGGGDMEVNTTSITAGGTVILNSWTITCPATP